MKKVSIFCILLTCFVINNVFANAANRLKMRLGKIDGFHASFIQKIIDSNGNLVQEGLGDLWVKRPNLFNFHLIQQNESILISDGNTVWLYSPFTKQVTAIWLKDIANDTPFILLMDNRSNNWQQYNIKQNSDDFVLTPKDSNSSLKRFTINVNSNGIIRQFNIIEQDNQNNDFELSSFHKENAIDASKFTFTLPQGVTVDDQRLN